MSMRREDDGTDAEGSRQLIWMPIVHTRDDMGGLRKDVEDLYIRRQGRARWDAHVRAVERLWEGIRREIDGLGLDYARVRLYQDGLPVCDHAEKIVRELAAQGNTNHRLLVALMDRGARLTGTESPQLLIEEYELNRRILGADRPARPSATHDQRIREEGRRLLDRRDQFIADRIAETLQPGECGLIFLGMLHSLKGRLPSDIRLTMLQPGDRMRTRTFPPR